jgi:hypothetical protein
LPPIGPKLKAAFERALLRLAAKKMRAAADLIDGGDLPSDEALTDVGSSAGARVVGRGGLQRPRLAADDEDGQRRAAGMRAAGQSREVVAALEEICVSEEKSIATQAAVATFPLCFAGLDEHFPGLPLSQGFTSCFLRLRRELAD